MLKLSKKQGILNRYFNSKNYSLFDCYKKPSIYKQQIYNDFVRRKNEKGGKGLKIVSFNLNIFTIGFVVDYYDKNLNYDHSILFYDTPTKHYEITFDRTFGIAY